jgi:hypothetical protein
VHALGETGRFGALDLSPSLSESRVVDARLTNFDGNRVHIAADGVVTVPNDPALRAFYVGPF